MKKYFVLFLTLLLSSVSLADKVTEQEALQKAQKFFKDKRIISRKSLTRGLNAEQQPNVVPEDYYIFNVEDKGGFVIISGDDRTPEVLGYADSGNLDIDNLPPNLKGWLEGYSKQIKDIETSGYTESKTNTRTATRTAKALRHRSMYMDDYVRQLDSILSANSEELLVGAGFFTHEEAMEKALAEGVIG